jgi:hypothetical protein
VKEVVGGNRGIRNNNYSRSWYLAHFASRIESENVDN